jgi:D12 class N6 adenine-specific DNA methyltransferase
MTARPFLKWAGGKQRLVHKLAPLLPRSFGLYVESFLGGGSLFWHLAPRRAVLGDANALLVATYRAVQKDPAAVAAAFRSLCPPGRIPNEADYMRVRNEPPIGGADIDVAGWSSTSTSWATTACFASTRPASTTLPSLTRSARRSSTKRT